MKISKFMDKVADKIEEKLVNAGVDDDYTIDWDDDTIINIYSDDGEFDVEYDFNNEYRRHEEEDIKISEAIESKLNTIMSDIRERELALEEEEEADYDEEYDEEDYDYEEEEDQDFFGNAEQRSVPVSPAPPELADYARPYISDFDYVRSHLFAKLVHDTRATDFSAISYDIFDENEESDIKMILTLSLPDFSEYKGMSVPINESILNSWGMSENEIRNIAITNTKAAIVNDGVVEVNTFLNIMGGFIPPEMLEDTPMSHAVIVKNHTEDSPIIAAPLSLTFPANDPSNVLATYAREHNMEDYVILPSSIYEIIAIPTNQQLMSLSNITNIIGEVNTSELASKDVLSSMPLYWNINYGLMTLSKAVDRGLYSFEENLEEDLEEEYDEDYDDEEYDDEEYDDGNDSFFEYDMDPDEWADDAAEVFNITKPASFSDYTASSYNSEVVIKDSSNTEIIRMDAMPYYQDWDNNDESFDETAGRMMSVLFERIEAIVTEIRRTNSDTEIAVPDGEEEIPLD